MADVAGIAATGLTLLEKLSIVQTLAIIISAIAAVVIISVTKIISRRRATIDMVLKLRLDPSYKKARKDFKAIRDGGNGMAEFACRNHTADAESKTILDVLNHYEFICVAIRERAICEKTYKRMLCTQVLKDWECSQGFVTEIRKTKDHPTLFQEFERIAKRWKKRPLKTEV